VESDVGSDLGDQDTAEPAEAPVAAQAAATLAAQPLAALTEEDSIASDIVIPRAPEVIKVAMTSLPIAQPALLPIEQLQPVLELAGLTLVQTAPDKRAEALARMASEPVPVRKPRERQALPPIEEGTLVQVETRRAVQRRAEM
jgi:ribonuclease E